MGMQGLCSILNECSHADHTDKMDGPLYRGAVYFVSMATWGKQRVKVVHITPATVLPSLHQAVAGPVHSTVAFEVALSIRRLIKKFGGELQIEWEIVLNILRKLKNFLHKDTPLFSVFIEILNDCISRIQDLLSRSRCVSHVCESE